MPRHSLLRRRLAALEGLRAVIAADFPPEHTGDANARLTPIDLAHRAGELGHPQENTAGMRWILLNAAGAQREHPGNDCHCSPRDLQGAARKDGPLEQIQAELQSQGLNAAAQEAESIVAGAHNSRKPAAGQNRHRPRDPLARIWNKTAQASPPPPLDWENLPFDKLNS